MDNKNKEINDELATAELNDLRLRYMQAVARIITEWAPGSFPHLEDMAEGDVHWPIIENSITPTPAEPRRRS